jgi:predicted alpha/beta-hydrolase family hydrolase
VGDPPDLRVYPSDPPRAACVIAHGAGAGASSPFLVRFSTGLAARGIAAATFDFPYMAAGRKVPDKPPVLEACWSAALERAHELFGPLPVFAGGKSLGGRIASHVAAHDGRAIAGLFFLGYPLHPPGNPEKRRDAHLPLIREPMLFVQGSRDAFGTSSEIAALIPSLQQATLHVVPDGDHSFNVRGSAAVKKAVLESLVEVVGQWIDERVAEAESR